MSEPMPTVPADLSFVTVSDFAAFLRKVPLPPDEKKDLEEALGTATEAVEAVVGPLANAAASYVVFPSGHHHLVLSDTHLVSVTSVTDPYGQALPVDMALADLQAGVLTWRHPLRYGAYTVVYTTREHGYSVKHAIKLIAAHLYDVRRGATVVYPAGAMAPAGDPVAARTGFAIPNRAAELLRPFLRGS